MATGHARRAFEAGDGCRVAICDQHWRPRWHVLWDGNPILVTPEQVRHGVPALTIQNASGCRPYIQYPFTNTTGWRWTGWRARDHVGRIVFTPEEERRAGAVLAQGPYVVIEPSVKRQATRNKDWGLANYQPVVEAFPGVRFVRPLYEDSRPFLGVEPLAGYTFRELCCIIAKAEAYVGSEGACHHAAAIAGVPGVVVFGGAVDPEITGYPIHVNLADPHPCGSWMPCGHCRAFLEGLRPETVIEALRPILARVGVE